MSSKQDLCGLLCIYTDFLSNIASAFLYSLHCISVMHLLLRTDMVYVKSLAYNSVV